MTNKEAIEILSNRLNTYYCTDEDLQALDLAIKALEERPIGHWIEGTQGYYCSECDAIDQFYFEHDFCSKCGADLRKETDND